MPDKNSHDKMFVGYIYRRIALHMHKTDHVSFSVNITIFTSLYTAWVIQLIDS